MLAAGPGGCMRGKLEKWAGALLACFPSTVGVVCAAWDAFLKLALAL
jgi:hypothetical protein